MATQIQTTLTLPRFGLRRSAQRRYLPTLVAAVAVAALLGGCGTTSPTSGVFLVEGGAPGWIGPPSKGLSWSPRNDQIAWGGEDGVAVWSKSDGAMTFLTNSPMVGKPAWAPDGKSIALIDRDAAAISVIDVATGAQVVRIPLVNDSGAAPTGAIVTFGGPTWSPDGSRIAFACRDKYGDELCIVNADGSQRRQVTRLEPFDAGSAGDDVVRRATSNVGPPSWSPDGKQIAVAAYPERKGAVGGVFLVELDRGNAHRVSSSLPNSEIVWYPDSRSLLFSASDKGRSDAIRVDLENESAARLTESLPAGARSPAVSANGELVSVASDGKIVIIGEAGVAEAIEVPGLRAESPAWNPAGEELAFLAVADPLRSYD